MKRLMIAGLLAVLAGCGPADPNYKPPPPPQPEIRVERIESPAGITVKVEYGHHSSTSYVKLDTLQKLQAYRKQVEFLSTQLEEAEKRMAVREQAEKKPE